jgi:hypothetical protein
MNHPIFKRVCYVISAFTLMLCIAGCSTYYGAAMIETKPDGAQVFDMEDGSLVGISSVNHVWRSSDTRKKFMNVRLQKDGYQDTFSSFWLNLDYTSPESARQHPQFVEFELHPLP